MDRGALDPDCVLSCCIYRQLESGEGAAAQAFFKGLGSTVSAPLSARIISTTASLRCHLPMRLVWCNAPRLNLTNNAIGDAGAAALSVLELMDSGDFNVSNNVGDPGAASLAGLIASRSSDPDWR